MKEYELKKVSIANIKIDGQNPNRMDNTMKKRLKKGMKHFGNTQPIVIDKNTMVLADGEHRLQQYIEEGLTEIPAFLVSFKNDAERRVYRQSSNKIRGEHLPEFDAEEYLKIMEAGEADLLNMATGLSLSEVEKHLRRNELLSKEEDFDLDAALEEAKEPTTKLGDVWKLGNHRLCCGDSTKEEDVNKLMNGQKANIAFTDPPYGVSYADKNKFLNKIDEGNRNQTPIMLDHLNEEDIQKVWEKSFELIRDNLTEVNSYYIFGPQIQGMMMMMMMKAGLPYRHVIIWAKNNHVLGRCDYNYKHEPLFFGWTTKHKFYGKGEFKTSLWEVDRPHSSKLHPTMKPLRIIENALLNSSQEEEICLDPFGGSGSTLIACEKLDRKCYMMELDPTYCDVIIKRWEEFTGEKAVKQ